MSFEIPERLEGRPVQVPKLIGRQRVHLSCGVNAEVVGSLILGYPASKLGLLLGANLGHGGGSFRKKETPSRYQYLSEVLG